MENSGFAGLYLVFDFQEDLSSCYVMSNRPSKKTIVYGTNGLADTKYFGSRDSNRFIRIYNKKRA